MRRQNGAMYQARTGGGGRKRNACRCMLQVRRMIRFEAREYGSSPDRRKARKALRVHACAWDQERSNGFAGRFFFHWPRVDVGSRGSIGFRKKYVGVMHRLLGSADV